mgnify:FL=1
MPHLNLILLANKSDLPSKVSNQELNCIRENYFCEYLRTSTKLRINLGELEKLISIVLNQESSESKFSRFTCTLDLDSSPEEKGFITYTAPVDNFLKPQTLKTPVKLKKVNQFKIQGKKEAPVVKANYTKEGFQVHKPKPKPRVKVSPLRTVKNKLHKPILTLEVCVEGQSVQEHISNGDNSYEVAKRVLQQVNSNVSVKNLQNLSEVIKTKVTEYMNTVATELTKYKQSVKKVQEEHQKELVASMKPPNLLTEYRAKHRKQLLGHVKVEISGEENLIPVYEGEFPQEVAKEFCKEKTIDEEQYQEILTHITNLVQSTDKRPLLLKMDFEIPGGQSASCEVREGDDLFSLAHRFVRDNKLGAKNTGRVYQMIKKTLEKKHT